VTDPDRELRSPAVLIVGAGPAGLSAATQLAPRVSGEVLVLEREAQTGGIPRHSHHAGFGVRDLHRFLTGPQYARRLHGRAWAAGARILTSATVTGWDGDGAALVTTPRGLLRIRASAVLLATGARERPRPARLIPGDRPAGVYTTGQLQNLVHQQDRCPGRTAVVVGAELVSWSAVLTLRSAGCRTILITTRHPVPESYRVLDLAGRLALRTPVAVRTSVRRILGQGRVRAVELEDLDTGRRWIVECDTVVLTGDWIPDHELARSAGLTIDPGSRAPLVDTALRTSRPGVFAAGNLVHPVDTTATLMPRARPGGGLILSSRADSDQTGHYGAVRRPWRRARRGFPRAGWPPAGSGVRAGRRCPRGSGGWPRAGRSRPRGCGGPPGRRCDARRRPGG
jgi:thioredoxin reductase